MDQKRDDEMATLKALAEANHRDAMRWHDSYMKVEAKLAAVSEEWRQESVGRIRAEAEVKRLSALVDSFSKSRDEVQRISDERANKIDAFRQALRDLAFIDDVLIRGAK